MRLRRSAVGTVAIAPPSRDGTPWHERTRDGLFEIISPDRQVMRGVWTMTRNYVRENLLLDEELPTYKP
jgi:hypothetical protein